MVSAPNGTRPRSELAMVRSVRRRLTAAGTKSHMEVPLLGHSIDLVFLDGQALCSVEFKLTNWRRAVRQAINHQLGADFAFICLPERAISPDMESLLTEHGIGLLFFQAEGPSPWRQILPAKASTRTWIPARLRMLTVFSIGPHESEENGHRRHAPGSLRHTG